LVAKSGIILDMLTTLEQIENVEAAIARAEAAQEFSEGGKRHRSADLSVLYKRREYLGRKYAAETGTGYGFRPIKAVDR